MKKHVMQYARFNLICLFLLSTTLAACGFQLRGVANLSFKSVFVQGSTLSISRELNQSFKTNGIQVVNSIEDAELLIEMLNETNEKRILSLSGGGVVREYELNYRVSFRTRDPASETWSAPQTVQARRDFSYNDNALLGKLDEENKLNTDMRSDAVREIMRRLSAIKVTAK
ncbi:MAG: LPS assembly lipoprotein LptE [Methylotenera sp.]|jgi:LPS-assembly lipoprotein|nr:LPS assembly lipoprotein LptE [Methylotenera sp.]HPM49082.1 LPS assembly lipoprotein LptE [Methylotenera sp.]HQM87440.1 LPS assembly lipoprotein LptE [Methylotenera sp.]